MVKKPTLDIEDRILREHIESLQSESQGNIIELSAAPTASVPLLEADEIGIYNNTLYQRKENTIYVYNSDSQITVT